MTQRAVVFAIVAVVAAVYPFLVYFGLSEYGIRPLAYALLIILSLRIILWQQFKPIEKTVLLVLVSFLCVLAAWTQSEELLRYYPVLMNAGFGAAFLLSLRSERSLIEQIMVVMNRDFPETAKGYLRGLTLAWGLLLMLNALVSFYTACCLSLKLWTIYNGAIAYLVFAVFTLGELVYRHFYKKRHE